MKQLYTFVLCTLLIFTAFAGDKDAKTKTEKESNFKIVAGIDIQAKSALWANGANDNLDQLFGRADLGIRFTSDKFQSALIIRAYPEGFGYEAITGVSFDYWYWEVKSEKTSIAKFQMPEAWAKYISPYFSVQVGRFITDFSTTRFFGNYLDLDPGGSFLSNYATHNAIEFSNQIGVFTTQIMLGVGDKNLNKGYLRIVEQIKPIENLWFSLGYRNNVFDLIHYKDNEVGHRIFAGVSYEIFKGFKPYLEVGIIDTKVEVVRLEMDSLWAMYWTAIYADTNLHDDFDTWVTNYYNAAYPNEYDNQVPILVGFTIPTGKILDMLAVEAEIISDRKINGKAKPVDLSFTFVKKLGNRVKFNLSTYTDPSSPEMSDWGLALRFSSSLN